LYFTSYLKYAGVFVLLILLQVTFIGFFLSIPNYNITPDIVILFVIYLGYTRGHIPGMISGFLSGIVLDFLSGSFIGLTALSYCISGFTAGYFNRQLSEGSNRKNSFLIIIFICTLIAYTIFYIIYFQGTSISYSEIFIKHILTTSLYTLVFGLIFAFFLSRFEKKNSFIV